MSDIPNVLTAREAAEYLRVSVATVQKLVRTNQLARVKVGASVRFRRVDLDSFLAEAARSA